MENIQTLIMDKLSARGIQVKNVNVDRSAILNGEEATEFKINRFKENSIVEEIVTVRKTNVINREKLATIVSSYVH